MAAVGQNLESSDIGFLGAVEIPGETGHGLFLRLVEREVANDFSRVGNVGGFRFLFLRHYLESGC